MIAQNINKLQPIVETFETTRQQYVEKLREQATLDADGNPEVSDELAAEFRENVESLLNEDQKVRLKKVTLIDDGNLSIQPQVLMSAMDYLIVKEDGNKAG